MNPSRNVILTIGIPASGKSTWAGEVAEDNELIVQIERDQIRKELTGDVRDHSREGEVTRVAFERARAALNNDMSVIVSDTNLKAKHRKGWRELADEVDGLYHEVVFDTPLEDCIARDAERENPVGREIIERMHAQLLNTLATTTCSGRQGGFRVTTEEGAI